ncbi:MAG: TVP38/TMEM64 family protein [Pseudomonadota bacterium]
MNETTTPPFNTPVDPNGSGSQVRRRLIKLWPLGLLAGGLLALYLAGAGKYFTLSFIIQEQDALASAVANHFAAALAGYLVVYAVAVAVSFPGASLITILGGFLFGALLGTALTVVAATLGATVLFLAAKSTFGGFLRDKVKRFAGRFKAGFEDNAFSYLFLLRLVPIFPFWLINIAPTMFDVKVRTYVVATALGIIPGTLAYSMLGSGLGATIRALEEQDPGCSSAGTCSIGAEILLTPGPLIAMAALCLVALIPVVVKQIQSRRRAAL